MRCDRAREAASARLDGEPPGVSAAALEAHLLACPDCSGWLDTALRITRQVRLGADVQIPDLAASILDDVVLPVRRVRRRRTVLRAALVVAGAAQLGLSAPAVLGDSIGMAMTEHAAHEGAAWSIAIGVALLAAAARPRRAAGLVPLLGTFIVALLLLSAHDILAGAVTADRLATHLAAVVGLVLLLALDRAERALPPRRRTGDAATPADDTAGHTVVPGAEPPARRHLRGVA